MKPHWETDGLEDWVGSRAVLEAVLKIKILSLLLPGTEARSFSP
jgi:hypothetical protein